jgi:nucleoside-diphosphate-sugar epimerase
MKILITGGTGFIGRRLVRRLQQHGHQVRLLARTDPAPDMEACGLEVVKGDVTNRDSLRGIVESVDMVYHLAGIGHVAAIGRASHDHFRSVNVDGLRNLLEEICGSGNHVSKFIHFSSTAAMGLIEGEADERSICCPETPYQLSKYDAEQLLMDYRGDSNLPVVVLRPSMVYGPGDRSRDFLSMCRLVKKGLFPIATSSEALTPLVYVDDVVQAGVLAGERGRIGETYIITSERSYPMRELVEALAEALGVRRGYVRLPCWTLAGAALASEAVSSVIKCPPALTRRRLKSIQANRSFSISKAVEELGYRPQVSLQEGVEFAINWYKSVGYL